MCGQKCGSIIFITEYIISVVILSPLVDSLRFFLNNSGSRTSHIARKNLVCFETALPHIIAEDMIGILEIFEYSIQHSMINLHCLFIRFAECSGKSVHTICIIVQCRTKTTQIGMELLDVIEHVFIVAYANCSKKNMEKRSHFLFLRFSDHDCDIRFNVGTHHHREGKNEILSSRSNRFETSVGFCIVDKLYLVEVF